ncbi:MAG: SDR family NAD(P)-dependent oxidoreductase [Gemmataceae bacterium]
MSKTILVTGAAGFIGSHVAEAFLARGDRVVGLDNLNDYYSPERKRANLAAICRAWPSENDCRWLEGDVRDAALIEKVFAEERFDAVVHLAALAGVRASAADPRLYLDVNLMGTQRLLEAAARRGVGVFVFASTSSVYGATRGIPFHESDSADRPLAPYPASKRAAEMLGFTYHHLTGLNFTALRFFTVYGPRNRPDMMAHLLADHLRFGRPVTLYRGGDMYRDWTFVGDIVQGVVAAADRPLGYEIINLGRGEPVLVADFVRVLEALAGRKADPAPGALPDTDVVSTHADIGKARAVLGYEPKVSVAQGAARFWEWYQATVHG